MRSSISPLWQPTSIQLESGRHVFFKILTVCASYCWFFVNAMGSFFISDFMVESIDYQYYKSWQMSFGFSRNVKSFQINLCKNLFKYSLFFCSNVIRKQSKRVRLFPNYQNDLLQIVALVRRYPSVNRGVCGKILFFR